MYPGAGAGGGAEQRAAEDTRTSRATASVSERAKVRRVGDLDDLTNEQKHENDMFDKMQSMNKEMQSMQMVMMERMNQQQQDMMYQQQAMFSEMMNSVCSFATASVPQQQAPPAQPAQLALPPAANIATGRTISAALSSGDGATKLVGEVACEVAPKEKVTAEQKACIRSVAAGFRKTSVIS